MGIETIATVVVSMAVGTVVGKIVEKVTGSQILGTIIGAAAGYGAGSLMSAGSTAAADTLASEATAAGAQGDAAFQAATGVERSVTGNVLDMASGVNGPLPASSLLLPTDTTAMGSINSILGVDPVAAQALQEAGAGTAGAEGVLGQAAKGVPTPGAQAGGQALSQGAAQGAGAAAQGAAPSFWQDPLGAMKGLFSGMSPMAQYGLINAGGQMMAGFSQGQMLEEQNKRADRKGAWGLPMDGSANGTADPALAGFAAIQAPTRPGGGAVVQPALPSLLTNVSSNTSLNDRVNATRNQLYLRTGIA